MIGCFLLAISLLVALGSASRRDLTGAGTVGYLFGTLAGPFLLMLVGRAIWCRVQKASAPVFDWAWLVFGTGLIALLVGFGNAGRDAEEAAGAAVPAVRVEVPAPAARATN